MTSLLRALPGAAALALIACASGTSNGGKTPGVTPVAQGAPLDASYDWHGLMLEPFGMLLKESPVPLHEVLLFHDDAHTVADADNKDCFAIDGTPPRFLGQSPDQLLLCFDHDRLNRIEASARLAAADAPVVFARACALWLKSTAAAAGMGTTCEGHDGAVAFSGRLLLVPSDAAATVSMTLTDVPREK